MAEKKLKISLDLDDKQFNATIKKMQEQLNQMYSGPQQMTQLRQISQKMQQHGLGTMPGAPSQQQYEQSQKKYRDDLVKDLNLTKGKYTELLNEKNKILQKEKEMSYEAKQALGNDEKKLKIQEQITETMAKAAAITTRIASMDEESNKKIRNSAADIPKMGAAIAAIITGVGAAVAGISRLPLDAASAMGSSNNALVGDQLKAAADPYHLAFMPERAAAMANARKAWQGQRTFDTAQQWAGNALVGAGAVGLGAAGLLGATGVGIPAGLVAGGLGVAAGGIGMKLLDSKQRAKTLGDTESYEKLSSQDLAEFVKRSQEAEENADPLKKAAAEYNAHNYQRNLGAQRGLGLSDQGFMGKSGFLQRNMSYGGTTQFTEEQVTQMQQAIMGAGGSARVGRESGYGLQLQKDYNLTNAPQMLANISKTMGGAQETKEASAKIIGEAFKIGLNDSDLVDLLRDFTQTTSEYVSRSGAKTPGDVSRISEQFGRGFVENTSAGMEAAKTAYEAYQKLGSQQGGPFSVMQRAAMLRNPVGRRLAGMGDEGAMLFEQLKKISPADLTEQHPVVQEAMYQLNKRGGKQVTAQDIMGMKDSTTAAGSDITGHTQENAKAVRSWLEKAGYNSMSEAKRLGADIPAEIESAARQTGLWYTATGTGAAPEITKAQEMNAAGASLTPKGKGFFPRPLAPEEPKTPKLADQENAAIAAGQLKFIQNFESFGKNLVPTATDVDKLTVSILTLGAAAAAVKEGKMKAEDYNAMAAKLGKSQPQANSSSAGKSSPMIGPSGGKW